MKLDSDEMIELQEEFLDATEAVKEKMSDKEVADLKMEYNRIFSKYDLGTFNFDLVRNTDGSVRFECLDNISYFALKGILD